MCQNIPTKRGIEIIYNIYYSKCSIYSQVVHVSNGRGISYVSRIHKKETRGDIFLGGGRHRLFTCMGMQDCSWVLVVFIRFKVLITQYLRFGPENSLVFVRLVVMVTRMCVNHWIGLMDGIAYQFNLMNMQLLSLLHWKKTNHLFL